MHVGKCCCGCRHLTYRCVQPAWCAVVAPHGREVVACLLLRTLRGSQVGSRQRAGAPVLVDSRACQIDARGEVLLWVQTPHVPVRAARLVRGGGSPWAGSRRAAPHHLRGVERLTHLVG
jgi:hypothetical protein